MALAANPTAKAATVAADDPMATPFDTVIERMENDPAVAKEVMDYYNQNPAEFLKLLGIESDAAPPDPSLQGMQPGEVRELK
jgi:hypothetical protein